MVDVVGMLEMQTFLFVFLHVFVVDFSQRNQVRRKKMRQLPQKHAISESFL